jgi:hypothetical protein
MNMAKTPKIPPPLNACDFHAAPANDALPNTLKFYELARGYIQHEDSLVNSRLTWSLTIHGFLFTIYGLLVGKAIDVLMELHKSPAPHLPSPLEHTIPYLAFLQVPVAVFAIVVSYYSKKATFASHYANQSINTIIHSSGALLITPANTVRLAIAQGQREVAPDSMSGIAVGMQILVDGGAEEAEVVTVTAITANTFSAMYLKEHKAGASVTSLSSMLLPRILGGGGGYDHTSGAGKYYLMLPVALLWVWILLGGVSIATCILSIKSPWLFY